MAITFFFFFLNYSPFLFSDEPFLSWLHSKFTGASLECLCSILCNEPFLFCIQIRTSLHSTDFQSRFRHCFNNWKFYSLFSVVTAKQTSTIIIYSVSYDCKNKICGTPWTTHFKSRVSRELKLQQTSWHNVFMSCLVIMRATLSVIRQQVYVRCR